MINESVRKVLNIISVINGIAFQTNIFALNAAMKEIVRAGSRVTTIKHETGAASIEQKSGIEHVTKFALKWAI